MFSSTNGKKLKIYWILFAFLITIFPFVVGILIFRANQTYEVFERQDDLITKPLTN